MKRRKHYLLMSIRVGFVISYAAWLLTLFDYEREWDTTAFYIMVLLLCFNVGVSVREYCIIKPQDK
jgi:hypothetical protein